MKRTFISVAAAAVFVLAVIFAQGKPPATAVPVKLPTALGAIHPRLSPDGDSIALAYQGEIWMTPGPAVS